MWRRIWLHYLRNMISSEHEKKLFLLDAYALIFRAYYAFIRTPRINSKGLNTGAMFGFTNTLLDILNNEKPSHIAVVFDAPEQTLREIDYEAYKANRSETPEDIKLAVPYIKKIVEAFNIPMLIAPGYEADDIIGTLAKKAEQKGFHTYMMTPDKDYGQLVSDKTFIYKPGYQGGKAEILGEAEVCAKFNIQNVSQVIDLLGLMGDAVDNIPGIPGIGEKTAAKLLAEFGSLEGLLENTDKLKGKQKENVENFREQGILSKKLATIMLDAPTPLDEEALKVSEINKDAIREVFEELEFRQLIKRVLNEEPTAHASANPSSSSSAAPDLFSSAGEEVEIPSTPKNTIEDVPHEYFMAMSEQELQSLHAELQRSSIFSFDTETSDLEPHSAYLVGLSFSTKAHTGWYVPISSNFEEAVTQLEFFKDIFADTSKTLVAQNYKFDYKMMKKYGMKIQNKIFDTMLAHYVINADGKHGMDALSESYLNYKPVSIESLIGPKGKNQNSMAHLPAESIKDYAAEDADVTLQLAEIFMPELEKQGTTSVLENIETPLIEVLANMEWEGIRVDKDFLNAYSVELGKELDIIEEKITELAGEKFNLDSPKQLGVILFEKLKITTEMKKTKTGQYSTGEDVLQRYLHTHEIVPLILDYRELRKLKSTYIDTLPTMINPITGRVHTNFMQAVAATGRLSSNQPNLQNIPIRTSRGKEIRKAFVARDEHHVLVSADYSQVELRIIAALSGDQNMIEAFQQGEDIHKATASKVFNVPLEEVTKDMRSKAKAVNFGIIYGQGPFGLAQQLGISRTEAKNIIEAYYTQFAALKTYQHKAVEDCRSKGFVETVLGRRRFLPDINSSNAISRSFAERNAVNAPIQGSAADVIKMAMAKIQAALKVANLKTKMVLQVHDELLFDTPKEEIDQVFALVKHEMENAVKLAVPLEVEIQAGKNWLEAH
jgi:DNA polymerase-1